MIFCSPWKLLKDSAFFREGKPRTEVVQNVRPRRKKLLLFRLIDQRQTCFYFLDLRQGTILIALLELIVWTFLSLVVFMVLLHVLQIEALIISEVEDSPARESIALSGLSGQEAIIAEVRNESRLQEGLNGSAYKVFVISGMLVSILVNIVSSVRLLLGAILRKQSMMLMWLCTTAINLFFIIGGMVSVLADVFVPCVCGFDIASDVVIVVCCLSGLWMVHSMLIVSSFYRGLFKPKKHCRRTNIAQNLHINIRPDWNTDCLEPDVEKLGESRADDGLPTDKMKIAVVAERNDDVLYKSLIPDLLPSSDIPTALPPGDKLV